MEHEISRLLPEVAYDNAHVATIDKTIPGQGERIRYGGQERGIRFHIS
jgi:hypothetical protein